MNLDIRLQNLERQSLKQPLVGLTTEGSPQVMLSNGAIISRDEVIKYPHLALFELRQGSRLTQITGTKEGVTTYTIAKLLLAWNSQGA